VNEKRNHIIETLNPPLLANWMHRNEKN